MAASHPKSKDSYYWYTSRQLLADSLPETRKFHTGMGHILQALKKSRYEKIKDMSMALDAEKAQTELLKQKNAALQAESDQQRAELLMLRAARGGAALPSPSSDLPPLPASFGENTLYTMLPDDAPPPPSTSVVPPLPPSSPE